MTAKFGCITLLLFHPPVVWQCLVMTVVSPLDHLDHCSAVDSPVVVVLRREVVVRPVVVGSVAVAVGLPKEASVEVGY